MQRKNTELQYMSLVQKCKSLPSFETSHMHEMDTLEQRTRYRPTAIDDRHKTRQLAANVCREAMQWSVAVQNAETAWTATFSTFVRKYACLGSMYITLKLNMNIREGK